MKSIIFNPEKDNTGNDNLNNFINKYKNEVETFGKDLQFQDNIWDITEYIELKKRTKTRLIFSNLKYSKESNNKRETDIIEYMKEPFLSFAKAYIRYRQSINPVKNLTNLLTSLRIIEDSMINSSIQPNPINLNSDILNSSTQKAKALYSDESAYRIGQKLEEISEFISEKNISIQNLDWRSSIKRPKSTERIGKKADDNRNKKMPSHKALEVLPEIFFNAKKPKDLLVSSIVALLFSAPNRINEVFYMPYNCEVNEKDSKGKELYGLRWFPEKGADPMIKWIIPSMINTVKIAIQRIKDITKTVREIAQWYEKNLKKIYLPKELESLRKKEYLTGEEASLIIFGKKNSSTTSFYKTHKIPYKLAIKKGVSGKKAIVKFEDLENGILKLLPVSMPYINNFMKDKYSDLLFIQNKYQYHSKKGTLIPTVCGFEIGFINDELGERGSNLGRTIFERFGYKEIDGSSIKVTTHQFRHYLNTLVQKGGASQIDIAKWSGRKNIQQNEVYDHVTTDEMLGIIRNSIGDKNLLIGPLSDIDHIKKKVLISRDEYAQLKVRTAHRTEFGVCVHDFSMLPCQHHMDCISCKEQVCMKGDKKGTYNIKERKKDVERLLSIAKESHSSGHISANKWVNHHSIELDKLTQLCKIFDDPSVPEGSIIQISNISSNSQIKKSKTRTNKKRRIEESPVNMDEMKELLNNIGDKI